MFLGLLVVYGHSGWPVTFEWDEKTGFKRAYVDLPNPVLSKAMSQIIVFQAKPHIASELRKSGWKAALGTFEVATFGGIPIVWGLSRTGYSKLIDPYKTSLMYAAEKDDLQSVKQILASGAKVNERDQDGLTALIYATRTSSANSLVIQTLISGGADVNIKDKRSQTALSEAAAVAAPVESIKLLIAAGGDVNARTDQGETPLMLATSAGEDEEKVINPVKALLDAGADINARDSKGNTALSRAIGLGRQRIAKFLTEASTKLLRG